MLLRNLPSAKCSPFSARRAGKPPSLAPQSALNRIRPCSGAARASSEAAQQQQSAEPSFSAPTVVTDDAVPEGHQSLHNFLYASGDTTEHSATRTYEFRQGEDDGESILPVGPYLESRDGERPLGVYALYDERHNVQYIGYSRNIVLAVKGHLSCVGESRCAFIRPMVFANKAMATRSHMEQQVLDWLAEAGVVPPGNGVEAHIWDGSDAAALVDPGVMSEAEAAAYHAKKLKLRKAMGDTLLDDVDADAAAADRRLALLAAVSGDNWSAVVSEQTQATLNAAVAAGGGRLGGRQLSPEEAAPHPQHVPAAPSSSSRAGMMAAAAGGRGGSGGGVSAAAERGGGSSSSEGGGGGGEGGSGSGPVVSPFSKASVHRQVGEQHKPAAAAAAPTPPPLTVASVTAALEDVRPYLLADGGDVEVLGITPEGVVQVVMQGACSSCASSSATLKMGIERQLKAVFGDAVSEVVQVNTGGGRPGASVEAINLHLNMLRSAVANLGGAVEVGSVGGGVAVLLYRGPAAIGKGLVSAVKDAFPDVREVVLKDFPSADEQQQQQ